MEPQMIKKVSITMDKLQNNKPCSLWKQGLLLYHGFCHLLSFVTPSLSPLRAGVGLLVVPDATVVKDLGIRIFFSSFINTTVADTLFRSRDSTSSSHKKFHCQCLNHWCLICYFLHNCVLI